MSGKVVAVGTLAALVALGAYLLPKLGWGTGGGKGDGGAGAGSADVSRATPSAAQGTSPAASIAQTPTGPLRIRVQGSDYYIGDGKVTLEQATERAKKAPKPPGGGAAVEIVYTGSARAGAEEALRAKLKEANIIFSEPETQSP